MPKTYEGVLHGDRIDWTEDRPDLDHPARVRVTVVEAEGGAAGRGAQMADALAKLAEIGGVSSIDDPQAWQRERRADRALPGRGE